MPFRRRPPPEELPARAAAVIGLADAGPPAAWGGASSPTASAGGTRSATARAQPASTAQPSQPAQTWVPQRWPSLPVDARAAREARRAALKEARRAAPSRLTGRGRHRSGEPRVLTAPVSLRGARVSPRVTAVAGVALVVLLAAAVFGVRVAWARAAAEPQPVASSTAEGGPAGSTPQGLVSRSVPTAFASPSTAAGLPGASPSAAGAGTPSGSPGVVVHVVGQVRRPGVVRLPPGSRVLDAVQAAGGATGRADLTRVNLARLVLDGEQVVVPKPGETPVAAPGPVSPAGGAGGGTGGGTAAPVNLNTADAAALDTLPGVGPVLAQRVLDWRSEHGRFTTVDELGEVSGIGEKLLAQIRPRVTL